MYRTCPKCGYQHPEPETDITACSACGLVYSKWLKNLVADAGPAGSAAVTGPSALQQIGQFLFPRRANLGRLEWSLCVALFTVLLFWGAHFIQLDFRSNAIGQSFLHNINLVFHEAGHVLFSPFGRFMTILGGSLLQVLVPLTLGLAFLFVNRDGFAASVGLWWTGQSLMDLSPYIADARAMRLPLLGGGTGADRPGMHDWNNILRDLGWLHLDQQVATFVHFAGSAMMLLALVWSAMMLRIHYQTCGWSR